MEFPDQYLPFLEMDRGAVALVVLRNLTLLASFVMALVGLARLPAAHESPGGTPMYSMREQP
jgi:hypothetical protein